MEFLLRRHYQGIYPRSGWTLAHKSSGGTKSIIIQSINQSINNFFNFAIHIQQKLISSWGLGKHTLQTVRASTQFNKHKNVKLYLVSDITIYCPPLFPLVREQLRWDCHVTVEVGAFTKIVARDGIKYRPIPVSRHAQFNSRKDNLVSRVRVTLVQRKGQRGQR